MLLYVRDLTMRPPALNHYQYLFMCKSAQKLCASHYLGYGAVR